MSYQPVPRQYLITGLAYWAVTYALLLARPEYVLRFAGKEQILELLGALFLLAASLTCFASSWVGGRYQMPRRRRFALLLLGLFFFVAFGEEVSWGQHLFGFQAPEIFRRHNIQGEINLHNLRPLDTFTTEGEKKTGLGFVLNSNRLFDYFMIALFLVTPLIAIYRPRIRACLDGLGVPILPAAFGVPLVVNFLGTAVAELFLVRDRYFMHIAVSEIRESNYALLCFLASLYWLFTRKAPRTHPEAVRERPRSNYDY